MKTLYVSIGFLMLLITNSPLSAQSGKLIDEISVGTDLRFISSDLAVGMTLDVQKVVGTWKGGEFTLGLNGYFGSNLFAPNNPHMQERSGKYRQLPQLSTGHRLRIVNWLFFQNEILLGPSTMSIRGDLQDERYDLTEQYALTRTFLTAHSRHSIQANPGKHLRIGLTFLVPISPGTQGTPWGGGIQFGYRL